jgi:hypothetical protein
MDVISFWDNIQFTPLYKEKGVWIHGATVDSGIQVQLRVVSKNKATFLRDMDWIFIYGTSVQEKERIQYFGGSSSINKVLSLHNTTRDARIYTHKWEPYTITVHVNPNVIDMYVPDDTCCLSEILSKPSFTIKKLRSF